VNRILQQSSDSVIQNVEERGGSDYPGIWTTRVKLRGVGSIIEDTGLRINLILRHLRLTIVVVGNNKCLI
jgi:hypothetical protein